MDQRVLNIKPNKRRRNKNHRRKTVIMKKIIRKTRNKRNEQYIPMAWLFICTILCIFTNKYSTLNCIESFIQFNKYKNSNLMIN